MTKEAISQKTHKKSHRCLESPEMKGFYQWLLSERTAKTARLCPTASPLVWNATREVSKIIFTTGLSLDDFEVNYIQDCLKKKPSEDGGKLFDTMLLGTIAGLDNNLDKYLEILLSLREKDIFFSAFKQMIAHTYDDSFDLPIALIRYHQELVDEYPGRAMQIQRIAELFMLVFELKDEKTNRELRNYFSSLPEHESMGIEMKSRLYYALFEGR